MITMKITRKQLKQLISESLAQDRAKLVDAMYGIKSGFSLDRSAGIDTNRATHYPSQQMTSQGLQNSNYYQARRSVKTLWNDLVEEYGTREYWDRQVKKFHVIGYAHDSDLDRYLSRLSARTPDFSAFGYDPSVHRDAVTAADSLMVFDSSNIEEQQFIIMIEMSGGRVTWAGNFDAWTEELGNKEAHHSDLYGNSLPKRPGYRKRGGYQVDEMLIDSEDVLTSGGGIVKELIMSNIGVENIDAISVVVKRWYLDNGYVSEEDLDREKAKIESVASKHGIDQVKIVVI
jgi:hypothetical protein